MSGQPTEARTRALTTHGREQELRQPMDASKSSVNPRTSAKAPSSRREDGCIKMDDMYRKHIAALRHKTTA